MSHLKILYLLHYITTTMFHYKRGALVTNNTCSNGLHLLYLSLYINPFQTVEKPIFSFLMLTYETKVPFTVHMPYRSIMCYISMESL